MEFDSIEKINLITMKKKLILLISISVFFQLKAQVEFGKFFVSNNQTAGVYGVLEKDLDNDGDMDLMSASTIDNTLAYYINDGTGNFTQTIITTGFDGAAFIDGADFDNDGDIDFAGLGTSDLSWFENDNGTFVEHSIATGLSEPLQLRLYDIGSLLDPATPDGDIDIGILVSGENSATVYMNDGSNNFSRLNIISVNSPKYLNGGDFDGDNTDDILISSYNNNEVVWYKLGNYSFVQGGTVTSNFQGAFGVEGGDIDLDGDDDVIATAFLDNEVAWFENDGSANFTKHVIDTDLPGASYIRWMDIDDDGDKDIIATGFGNLSGGTTTGHQVVVYYNDGAQNFTKTIVDNTEKGPATFCLQDFNGDNTIDIIYAANISGKIIMLGQGVTGSIGQNGSVDFNVYPNPAVSVIRITAEEQVEKIDLFDITGRKVLTTTELNIPVAQFTRGYYFLQIHFVSGEISTRKILMK